MVSRREVSALLVSPLLALVSDSALADTSDGVIGEDAEFDQLTFPPLDALDEPELFGYKQPTAAQRDKARKIIDATPKGPTPFAIGKSFIDRFARTEPDAISQWPSPSTWNPLIKEFFSATSLRVNNDMINWCAAFANWCIERNNKKGTNSAASQSFVDLGMYKKAAEPSQGNLVVFTCYDRQSGKSLGLGHVAFFEASVGNNKIRLLGGNQSGDGHSSIISERIYLTTPFEVHRHVGGEYIPCIYKLNSFLVVA